MDGKDIIEKYLNDNEFEDLKDYEGIYNDKWLEDLKKIH